MYTAATLDPAYSSIRQTTHQPAERVLEIHDSAFEAFPLLIMKYVALIVI